MLKQTLRSSLAFWRDSQDPAETCQQLKDCKNPAAHSATMPVILLGSAQKQGLWLCDTGTFDSSALNSYTVSCTGRARWGWSTVSELT